MAWKQDSIKQVEVTVVQDVPPPPPPPEGEGKAEVIDVYSDPSSGSPGDTLHVRGGVKNIGGRDNIRFVICFLEPYLEGASESSVFTEKIEEVWPDGQIWLEGDFTIPLDYTGATITLAAIGFHEE